MNEIITIDDSSFDVGQIQTLEDVKEFISRLETLKKILEHTQKWHENICKYCALEAQAYIRAAELNGNSFFRGTKRKVIDWLSSLSPGQQADYVRECFMDGISIEAIFKRDYSDPEKRKNALERIEDFKELICDEFENKGIVTIKEKADWYLEDARKVLGSDVVTDCIDGLRKQIRAKGGYGINDRQGTYVSAEAANYYIKDVVSTRVEGISNDVGSLADLTEQMKRNGETVTLAPVRIERANNLQKKLSYESAVNVMLSLMGVYEPELQGETAQAKLRTIDFLLRGVGTSIAQIFDLLLDTQVFSWDEWFYDSNNFSDKTKELKVALNYIAKKENNK